MAVADTDPAVNGAAMAVVADHTVGPVNGASTMVISDASAFAMWGCFDAGNRSENAQTKQGGEEQCAEFHTDDGGF